MIVVGVLLVTIIAVLSIKVVIGRLRNSNRKNTMELPTRGWRERFYD